MERRTIHTPQPAPLSSTSIILPVPTRVLTRSESYEILFLLSCCSCLFKLGTQHRVARQTLSWFSTFASSIACRLTALALSDITSGLNDGLNKMTMNDAVAAVGEVQARHPIYGLGHSTNHLSGSSPAQLGHMVGELAGGISSGMALTLKRGSS